MSEKVHTFSYLTVVEISPGKWAGIAQMCMCVHVYVHVCTCENSLPYIFPFCLFSSVGVYSFNFYVLGNKMLYVLEKKANQLKINRLNEHFPNVNSQIFWNFQNLNSFLSITEWGSLCITCCNIFDQKRAKNMGLNKRKILVKALWKQHS